jgi:3-phenylpropionate/trans-cinnamate dioxygenase ferredoxin reductase subunit
VPEEVPSSIVVAGAGLAGASAVTALRQQGYDGRLTLFGAEDEPPYERPPLSKELLRGEQTLDEALVRPARWYEEHDVDARFGTRAVQLDVHAREVVVAGGARVSYDRLIVATGGRNRKLDVPGAGLPGVFDLRYHDDALAIRAAATPGARVVCVGMGFVGAEVAASLRSIGCDVTVVEIFETTLYRILGPELGRVLEGIHRDHGVTMHFSDTVERFEGDGRLERVLTEAGRSIDADVAVVGVGTEPSVELFAGTGLDQGGGVPVGPTLETSIPGVFAIGDVARHDHPVFGPVFGPLRVEHYDNAVKMGEHVAGAALGSPEPFDDPHWFWSDQYDSKIEMAGFAPTWDRVVVRGSLEERSFCAFLVDDGGVVRSTVSLDRKRDVRRSFGLIRAQAAPDPALLADPDVDLRTLVPEEAA